MAAVASPAYDPELHYTPTKKQSGIWDIMRKAKHDSRTLIGYGGAAGGGKTRALAELAIDLALEFPGNKILIGRKDFSDLRSTTMEQFDMYCPPHLISKKNDTEHWRNIRRKNWPPGVVSKVIFRELKDYMGLGSEEYGAVLIDEAGEVPVNSALMLFSRLRWRLPPAITKHGFHMKYFFVAASNPYPGWFKQWFVERTLPEEVLSKLQTRVHFVPALAKDNPYLPPGYEMFLRSIYPADWVKRLMDGDWDVFIGQVYPAFAPNFHEWKFSEQLPDGKWVPIIPKFKRIIGGLDFGEPSSTAHKSTGIVAGVMESGRLLRLDEFEENGPDVTLRQINWMMQMEEKWLEHVKVSRWSDDKPRIAWCADKSQMAAIQILRGKFVIKPSKGGPDSVKWGIRLVADRLHVDPVTKLPGSYYLPHLIKFREAMERYRWPERDESLPQPTTPLKVDDDLVDADRYMHELAFNPYGRPEDYKNEIPRYAPEDVDDTFTRKVTDNPFLDAFKLEDFN